MTREFSFFKFFYYYYYLKIHILGVFQFLKMKTYKICLYI